MEFPFGRQISKDSLLNKTGEASRSLKSSITSGSSRLFDSVKSKKTGFFDGISSGISNTFDQVMTIGGGKEDEDSVEDAPQVESPPSPALRVEKPKPAARHSPKQQHQQQPQQTQQQQEEQIQVDPRGPAHPRRTQPQPDSQPQKPAARQAPPKPPPARPSRPPVPSPRNKTNGSIRGQPGPGRFSRQQTAPADFDPSGDSSDIAINVDEPLYGRQYSLRSGSVDLDQDSGFQDTTSSIGGGSNTSPADGVNVQAPIVSTRISKNPFLNDPMPDSEYTTMFTRAEVYNDGHTGSNARSISDLDPVSRMMAANNLGSDLLPGIPRVPSNNTALLAPQQQQGQDLLAITPTSGEALPLPSLEPTRRTDSDEIYDISDGDSEDTEGCDEAPDPEDYGGTDYDYGSEGPMFRSGSVGSEKSWHSNQSEEGQLDYAARACRDFMKGFVNKTFSTKCEVSQSDKATFGQFCQQSAGRLWFARYVNAQRVNSKSVPEEVFYSLVQYFAVALFECNEADDFTPAKILMNMCFTFYLEVPQSNGPILKHFLYTYLRDQRVWQSIRFWNAAFFDAVQHERASRPMPTRETGREGQTDDRQYQENITFGQLGTFTCNMRAFGLSTQLCIEFVRKQSTIANLSKEQVAMLRENIEKGSN